MCNIRRGVYRARTLTVEGFPYLTAIAADLREIQRVTVYPWDCEDELAAILFRRLDNVDPKPGPRQEGGDDA